MAEMHNNVVVEIVEQPAKANGRFRYKNEGILITGANATASDKTYPAIRVLNYTGTAFVVVSCVTTDQPYRQHPNNLVGKICNKGVCAIEFKTDESAPTVLTFEGMGIQCCKKNDIASVLSEREECCVDPFMTGFKHKSHKMNLKAVRLCFHVFLKSTKENGENQEPVLPVVSDIVRSRNKYFPDYKIRDISDISSPATGGKKIMIVCDKLPNDDIKIRFYRENADKSVSWEAWGLFDKKNVHHQNTISVKTPAYETIEIGEPVNVLLQIIGSSDDQRSESHYFKYIPDYSNIDHSIKNKKRKIHEIEAQFQHVQGWEDEQRKTPKMEININLNTEYNEISSSAAAQRMSTTNESECEWVAGNNPAQSSNQLSQQQPYFQSQSFPQNFHHQHSDQLYQPQSHFPQRYQPKKPIPQRYQPQSHLPQSQNSQQYHHNQMYPLYQSIHSEYHPHLHDKPLNLSQEFNIGCVKQEEQQKPQQQYLTPSNFYSMYSKDLSSSASYNPLSNHQNAIRYNTMQWHKM